MKARIYMQSAIHKISAILKLDSVFLYLTICLTGGIVLILQILGTKIIGPFYGSTIYVWSSQIVVTLGFLALGYIIGGWLIDKLPKQQVIYSIILLSALCMSLILKIDEWVLINTDQFGLEFGPLAASIILFAPTIFLLSMIGPMIIRLESSAITKAGSTAGRVFAFSTLGSVGGALLAGFYLLPRYSISMIFETSALLLALLALVGLFGYGNPHALWKKAFAIFIIVASFLIPHYQYPPALNFSLVAQHQSVYGDIKVIDFPGYEFGRCLYVSGSAQSCIDNKGNTDGFFQRFLAKELAERPLAPGSKVLLLGLGGAGVLSNFSDDIEIDIIELDPEIVTVTSKYFQLKSHPNVEIVLDDARHYLATAESGQYDLILENIALGNSIPSYVMTRESFADMHRLIKPNGSVMVHLGTHSVGEDNRFNTAIYSTASSVFPYSFPISSNPDQVLTFIMQLSNVPIQFRYTDDYYDPQMEIDPQLIATDNFNKLDHYFMPNAIAQWEGAKTQGNQLFFIQ